jgi:SAM-dependent methyltransferase
MAAPDDARASYRVSTDADQVEQERARLLDLAAERDPSTRRTLEEIGVGPGWACCDVGSGAGTIASWLAERVRPGGRVVALDVDGRFHQAHPDVEMREQDVTASDIGDAEFDLVHARGVLQHLHQREDVLDTMVAATAPGGWIVVTDTDWIEFDAQPIPEPFGELARRMRDASVRMHGYDTAWGRRLLPAFHDRGLTEVRVDGAVYTMRGGTPSAEWYVAGLARALDRQRELGTIPAGFPAEEAITQARDPGFAILSPISLTARGRRPHR